METVASVSMSSTHRTAPVVAGSRVRLITNPNWIGTVTELGVDATVWVDWDNHGVELTHRGLLDIATDE